MPNSPPTVPIPPTRTPMVDPTTGQAARHWVRWTDLMHKRVGGASGIPIVGDVAVFETTVDQSDLASAASKIILNAATGEQWKLREILLSGAGTNFNAGGDRDVAISDGTSTWTVIPAATLKALAAARWGDAGVPFPSTAAHLMTASAAGTDITAAYSGGTTDYTSGSLTLAVTAERMA